MGGVEASSGAGGAQAGDRTRGASVARVLGLRRDARVTRTTLGAHLATAALVLAACASDVAAPDAATGLDAGPRDNGTFFTSPDLDPARFDCRVAGQALTRPASAAPLACGFDPACTTPLVVGHRLAGGNAPGVGNLAPENTLSALRAAIVLGVDFIETDPRETRDGELVNVHDPEIGLVTTSSGPVSSFTRAELQAMTLKIPAGMAGDFGCDRVITIRELLVAAKGRVNVLLDANKIPLDAVPTLVRLVVETDTLGEAVFDTSSLDKVERARAIEPRLRVHIRPDAPAEIEPQLARVPGTPPVILEVDIADLDASVPIARRLAPGAKLMVNALGGLDLAASISGAFGPEVRALYTRGAQLVQTDRPDLLLRALGR
jgi:glycerophosphoryl diester phosphodiesterase